MNKQQKIAIVCGHFMPEVGYVEVQMAKALSKLGHDVHVFTTNLKSPSVKDKLPDTNNYSLGTIDTGAYQIKRLPAYFSLGQMVKSKELENKVEAFNPDLILVIGLGKLFPKPILVSKKLAARKVVLLADNEDSFDHFKGVKGTYKKVKKQVLRSTLKDPVYELAVKHADQFFAYTPSAPEVVLNYLPKDLHQIFLNKVSPLSLGFDDEEFYFDESIRTEKRQELELSENDKVLITATRITPFKNIERIIDVVEELNEQKINCKYFIAGFGTDNYSNELKNYVQSKKHAEQIICLPFLSHEELLRLYNAADLGYWPTHIITHYEASGTGLPILLPDKKNIQHIIEQGVNGWKFNDKNINDIFKEAIFQLDEMRLKRKELAVNAKERFAFTKIAQKVV